jgi:hypothetical protein
LLERPGKLIALGVGIHKIEEVEVSLSITHDAMEIVDLKQAQITVIILDALLLKLGALFGSKLISFTAGYGTRRFELMVSEERLATVRPHSVGPAGEFHLKDAQIDAQLQFLPAIEPQNFAHLNGTILVRPVLENRVQVKAHLEKMMEHLVFNCQSPRGGNVLKSSSF